MGQEFVAAAAVVVRCSNNITRLQFCMLLDNWKRHSFFVATTCCFDGNFGGFWFFFLIIFIFDQVGYDVCGLNLAALRGAATLKARALKEVWNIAAVIPVEKNLGAGAAAAAGGGSNGSSNSSFSGELVPEENFLGICSRELLARGCELLKRTRTGIFPEILPFCFTWHCWIFVCFFWFAKL